MVFFVFSQKDGLQNNAYVLVEGKKALVIDPSFQEQKIENLLTEKNLTLEAVLLTHAHFDHMGNGQQLAANHEVQVHVSVKDKPLFDLGLLSKWRKYDREFRVAFFDEHPQINTFDIKVLPLPGHSPGSVGYIFKNMIFTGDSVLQKNLGPTSLPLSDPKKFEQTVRTFMSLSDDLKIMPGHYGYGEKLSEVKKSNPELLAFLDSIGYSG